jgi:hypothetical protein
VQKVEDKLLKIIGTILRFRNAETIRKIIFEVGVNILVWIESMTPVNRILKRQSAKKTKKASKAKD